MPKGKKKGKKGKDKGGKKKASPPPVQIEEEPLNEVSKEFYWIQIRDLEQRVARYQTKCDYLTVANEDLNKKLTQQTEDQEHIIALLKKKMQEQSEKCLELDDQLSVEKHERHNEVDKLSKEMALIKEEAQDRLDQLIAENTILHGTLESLEDFKINKERIEAELKEKQVMIEKQQKEFNDKIYLLEKQAVLDKDRLRKEMVMKVNSVASEFRKVSDLQMADTTKRTIQENVSMTQQLHRMSDKTAELIRENEKLKERERRLALRLETIETNEQSMTRKNVSNQKILVMLRDKVKQQEDTIRSLQEYKEKYDIAEKGMSDAQHTSVITTQQAEQYKVELKSKSLEYEKLQQLYTQTKEELEVLKTLLSNTSATIKSFVKEPRDVSTSELLPTLFELLLKAPTSRNNSTTTLIGSSSYQPGDLNIVPKRTSSVTKQGLPPLNPMKS